MEGWQQKIMQVQENTNKNMNEFNNMRAKVQISMAISIHIQINLIQYMGYLPIASNYK